MRMADAIGRFALESPYTWPSRWRRIYAPIYPLGFVVRMTARVLVWTCVLIPWGIVAGLRDHAEHLRRGNGCDRC